MFPLTSLVITRVLFVNSPVPEQANSPCLTPSSPPPCCLARYQSCWTQAPDVRHDTCVPCSSGVHACLPGASDTGLLRGQCRPGPLQPGSVAAPRGQAPWALAVSEGEGLLYAERGESSADLGQALAASCPYSALQFQTTLQIREGLTQACSSEA